MIQQLIIGVIFLASVLYVFRTLARNFRSNTSGCAKGCGCDVSESVLRTEITKKNKNVESLNNKI